MECGGAGEGWRELGGIGWVGVRLGWDWGWVGAWFGLVLCAVVGWRRLEWDEVG